MNVFVTGATGYVGFNVASVFRRAGHRVYGLTRSDQKANFLWLNEIIPVLGDMQTPDSYANIAEICPILIHAAADYERDLAALDRLTIETFLKTGKKSARPKTILYTGGAWDYGDTGGKVVDESSPPSPPPFVSWRPQHADMVLNAPGMKGIVVRPGDVFGKQGGLTNSWCEGAFIDRNMQVFGSGNNHWPLVHVDDLAHGYLRAAESGLSGEIFNFCDSSRSTVREIAEGIARTADYNGKIASVPLDQVPGKMRPLAHCLAMDQCVDNRKSMRLLGWRPKHLSFTDDVEIYCQAWKMHREYRAGEAKAA